MNDEYRWALTFSDPRLHFFCLVFQIAKTAITVGVRINVETPAETQLEGISQASASSIGKAYTSHLRERASVLERAQWTQLILIVSDKCNTVKDSKVYKRPIQYKLLDVA